MANLLPNSKSQLVQSSPASDTASKPMLSIKLTDNGKSAPIYTAVVGDSEASSANSLNAIALAVLAALADTGTIESINLNGVQVKLVDLVDRGVDRVLGRIDKSDSFKSTTSPIEAERTRSLALPKYDNHRPIIKPYPYY